MNFEFDDNIDADSPIYQIGKVAELLNISVHTLRLYENEGLVIPFKKDSKHRLYSQNDIKRLICIRNSITQKKYSIAAIKALYSMIPCWSLKKCELSERNKCEAYSGTLTPCWTVLNPSKPCDSEDCRVCPVYKTHYNCDSIKTTIKKLKY